MAIFREGVITSAAPEASELFLKVYELTDTYKLVVPVDVVKETLANKVL